MIPPVSPKPLTKDEWFTALLSPDCSNEAMSQIKKQKNETSYASSLRRIDSLPKDEQIKEMIRVCREQMDKKPCPNRLQVQC